MDTFYSQENSGIAYVSSKAVFLEGKTNGRFKFKFPAELNKEDVDKSASYYAHNFAVNFDNISKEAEVIMASNTEQSRKIIVRFLSACGVQYIQMEDSVIALYPFYDMYIK